MGIARASRAADGVSPFVPAKAVGAAAFEKVCGETPQTTRGTLVLPNAIMPLLKNPSFVCIGIDDNP
jgi:hypothetical protein